MKVEKNINYTVQVTSKSEQYTITGNVNVDNMNITGVSSAFVKETESQENVAEFSWYGGLNLNLFTEMSDTETFNLIKDIKTYINDAKTSAESGLFETSIKAEKTEII